MNLKAVRFFADNAGYSTPPGRMKCAALLAEAESWARDEGLVHVWSFEEYPDHSWMDDSEREREHITEQAGLYRPCPTHGIDCLHAELLASLGNIVDADETYRRIVNAELALEAMPKKIVGIVPIP